MHVNPSTKGNVLIRPAAPTDVPGMARVRVKTWRSAYAGIVPAAYLETLSAEKTASRLQAWLFDSPHPGSAAFVSEANGDIVGIAVCGPDEEGDAEQEGRVFVLYILPAYQRRGIGRGLMHACTEHLLAQGMRSLTVWVLKDNPYRQFYELLGGTLAREKEIEIGGVALPEVAYYWDEKKMRRWQTRKRFEQRAAY